MALQVRKFELQMIRKSYLAGKELYKRGKTSPRLELQEGSYTKKKGGAGIGKGSSAILDTTLEGENSVRIKDEKKKNWGGVNVVPQHNNVTRAGRGSEVWQAGEAVTQRTFLPNGPRDFLGEIDEKLKRFPRLEERCYD